MSIPFVIEGLRKVAEGTKITRDNFEDLLDRGQMEIAMKSGKWWAIRRNGKTRRWKREPSRIYVPFKCGMKIYGNITELHFRPDGQLDPTLFRRRGMA